MSMKFKSNVHILCNLCSTYSLLLYSLIVDDSALQRTFYIFNPAGIHPLVRRNLKNSYTMPKYHEFRLLGRLFVRYLGWIWFRIIKCVCLPDMTNMTLIGNDHSIYDGILYGDMPYTLVEDSPNGFNRSYCGFFKIHDDFYKSKHRLKSWFIGITFGNVRLNRFGNNHTCQSVITTSDVPTYLSDKYIHLVDIKSLWNDASIFKREYILRMFNIAPEIIQEYKTCKSILFTQPLYPDYISKDEHIDLYMKIVKQHSSDGLIIKPHPRDTIDYKSLQVVGMHVLPSYIPIQLLTLLNIKVITAITLFSTAVEVLQNSSEILWYGGAGNDVLDDIANNITPPIGAIKCFIK